MHHIIISDSKHHAYRCISKGVFLVYRQSYDVDISLNIPGTNSMSTNSLDLKNPFFRYTGQQPQQMPGTSSQSPTDAYWSSLVTGREKAVLAVMTFLH